MNTIVATEDGEKPISEVQIGDILLGYNPGTDEVGVYHVLGTYQQQHDTTLEIIIDGEAIHTTDEHPFYVNQDGDYAWIEAQDLRVDDLIVNTTGQDGVVEAITIIDAPQIMYNLTVALVANYLVGAGQWVVHNFGTPSKLIPIPNGIESIRDLGQMVRVLSMINQLPGEIENAFLLQPNGFVWAYLTGGSGNVGPRKFDIPFIMGGGTIIHNHPRGLPLSISDIRLAGQYDINIIAVGSKINGATEVFSATRANSITPFPKRAMDYWDVQRAYTQFSAENSQLSEYQRRNQFLRRKSNELGFAYGICRWS